MLNNNPVDHVILKVKGTATHNSDAGTLDGYMAYVKNKAPDIEKGKIFVVTESKDDATVFARYKTKTPTSTGFYYAVHNSEDDDGTALWLDETSSEGIVYVNRRSIASVTGFTGNIHSWKEGDDTKKKRLRAFLGTASTQLDESLALADKKQQSANKENGGKEIFCNIKHNRDGLSVDIIKVKVAVEVD